METEIREPHRLRRQRRPSGEPPPLPHTPGWTRWAWLCVVVFVAGIALRIVADHGGPYSLQDEILEWAASLRSAFLNDVAKAIALLATTQAILGIRLLVVLVLAFYKRWRHVVVALAAFSVMDLATSLLSVQLPALPSPDIAVTPIVVPTLNGEPAWYFPALAISALAITLYAAAWCLVPAGPWRSRARGIVTSVLLLVCAARIELGSAYPTAAVYAVALGAAVAFLMFEWFTPDESFPVSYRRGGNAAHLELAGRRSDAVKLAMREQLGLEVDELQPFGNEGSGGSTPLLMTLDGGTQLFGKILATSHARADRWYRIGRTIMYGQLEDETPFGSVRRLIDYEDYALRLLDDEGFRIAKTYGVVELTPNREYLLPTEFFAGSSTLGHADVTPEVVDEGLALVRRLWDSGLAHRDIKPANLLMVDGHLQLIDVSGLEVRPSPWRQAVDLANMMLVMALRTDPDSVYERALTYFTPDEIAEAFASAIGMAVPTELQRYLKEDDRDLVGRFKELAPSRRKISIQRWSLRRVAYATGAFFGLLFVVSITIDTFSAGVP
jgi:hypothetical protein